MKQQKGVKSNGRRTDVIVIDVSYKSSNTITETYFEISET